MSAARRRLHALWRPVRHALRALTAPIRRMLRPSGYNRILKRIDALDRNVANLLSLHYAEAQQAVDPRLLMRAREFQVFSQNGEDGLLLFVFAQIGAAGRRFVEFGIQDGRECNAANLAIHFGWSGLFLEASPGDAERARRYYHGDCGIDRDRVRIVQARVTAENIDSLLRENGMAGEIDLLSIDIDSFDYWVWRAVSAVVPRVVAIEYNASLGPELELVVPYGRDLETSAGGKVGLHHGASLAALHDLGLSRGYALVGCESNGVNAFFVRKELLAGQLREMTPAQAYYPHRRRGRKATPAEQLQRALELDFQPPPGARA